MNISSFLLFSLLTLATFTTTAHSSPLRPPFPLELHPTSEKGHHRLEGFCESWRLAAETHNLRDFGGAPPPCRRHVREYMHKQYALDFELVVSEAAKYSDCLPIRDGDAWVFDVDETTLSNLEFFQRIDFWAPFDQVLFDLWKYERNCSALPTLGLYRRLLERGVKVVFLTGRSESLRQVTADNLRSAGFQQWERLLLKNTTGGSVLEFKAEERKKLEAEGFRIVGNMGDQWCDISRAPEGMRTFKLPNPVYYVA